MTGISLYTSEKLSNEVRYNFYFFDPEDIKNSFFRANTQILKSECTT